MECPAHSVTALAPRNSATAPGVTNTGASSNAASVIAPVHSDRAGAHLTRPSSAEVPGPAMIRAVERQSMASAFVR